MRFGLLPLFCVFLVSFFHFAFCCRRSDRTITVSFWVFTGPMGRELTPSIAFASLAVWNELR